MTFDIMKNYLPKDILWVLFLPPSDAYVRSFLYVLYTLIKLYYTHTHKKNKQKIFCNFLAFEIVQFPIYKVLSFILVILIHNSVDSLMSILLPFNRTEKIETCGI